MTQRTSGEIVERVTLVCAILGLLTGFIRGLFVYIPTAWAAAFEVGIPAAILGILLGLAIAGARQLARRIRAVRLR